MLEWADTRVESAAHFEQLYDAQTPGELVPYRVLRNRRRFTGGTVVPDADCEPVRPAPVRLPRVGLALAWDPDPSGWMVTAVAPDGPSARAGIEERDRFLSIDGIRVSEEEDLETIENRVERGEPILVSIRRDDRMKLVAVVPVEEPAESTADVSESAERDISHP